VQIRLVITIVIFGVGSVKISDLYDIRMMVREAASPWSRQRVAARRTRGDLTVEVKTARGTRMHIRVQCKGRGREARMGLMEGREVRVRERERERVRMTVGQRMVKN